ncbi:MAG: hypothetical protein K2N31_10685 [Treponemataceae bacterium]|nr:hypothetical protein [Treponemataceae bacterium]
MPWRSLDGLLLAANAEREPVVLGDGAHKIFYNAAKHAIMPSGALQSFFRFLAGTADGSALSGRLAAMVEYAKTNARIATKFPAQWRQQFMTWEDEMKLQVKEHAEVLAQELAEEAAVETARKLLGKNVAMEIVSEATGLPLAQVEQLR